MLRIYEKGVTDILQDINLEDPNIQKLLLELRKHDHSKDILEEDILKAKFSSIP
jgi:hypothetical protein